MERVCVCGGGGTNVDTPGQGGRGSKLVENMRTSFMDDRQHIFIGEELREKSIHLLLHSGKMIWLLEWKIRETQGKFF